MPTDGEIAAVRTSEHPSVAPLQGVRRAAREMIVVLLIQYALGMWVNLFATLPASDHGKTVFAALGNAISKGPVELSLHAILGVLILIAAIVLLVRAIRAGQRVILVASVLGLVAVVVAGIGGVRFVATQSNGESLAMALALGFALLCYFVAWSSERLESPGL